MAFSDKQVRALKAKLAHRYVKTRSSNGVTLSYVEGWHVIAEANRIFGFENWDRRTLEPRCLWTRNENGNIVCFYATRVRIKVRAGETTIVREGTGTGIGRSSQADVAHEIALKAAETDATKRALATFGNPFGLALYDKCQTGVSKPKRWDASSTPPSSEKPNAVRLRSATGEEIECANGEELLKTLGEQLQSLTSLKALYRFWEDNKTNFSKLGDNENGLVQEIMSRLKERAREVSDQRPLTLPGTPPAPDTEPKSNFLLPKERRVRNKAHLEFVRSNPCVICGRTPVHAHHLRFAQKRAMGMKVSDEFTVPLCSIHHDAIHKTGDERAWWARHGVIEPLKLAEKLWMRFRGQEDPNPETKSENQDRLA